MAVEWCVELPEESCGRDAESRWVERTFRVKMAAATDSAVLAEGAVGIPAIGDAHPVAITRKCQLVNVRKDQDRLYYLVTARYTTPVHSDPADPGGVQDNPLLDPIQVDWGYWGRELAITEDVYGNPIVNAANDPFDPPYTDEVHNLMVTVTRNEATFNPVVADSYTDATNNDNCTIAGLTISPRQACCLELSGRTAWRNDSVYWVVTYRIAFKADLWDVRLANQGFYQLVNLGGTWTKLRCTELSLDYGTEPAREPQWLRANGLQEPDPLATKIYGVFRLRPELPFAYLNLAAPR